MRQVTRRSTVAELRKEKHEGRKMMNYSNEELIKLWANSEKRKAFVETYKEWGIYACIESLALTYYKYILPDGAQIFVMEHMQEVYRYNEGGLKWESGKKYYLQKGDHFEPRSVGLSTIDEHLMSLKQTLLQKKGGDGGV
jgi:hypothetical protein